MTSKYYILTDKVTKKIIVSTNLNDMYQFVLKNKNTRIRTIDYTAKAKILNRKDFLMLYKQNKVRFFVLAEVLIKRKDDIRKFFKQINTLDQYDYYLTNKNKTL